MTLQSPSSVIPTKLKAKSIGGPALRRLSEGEVGEVHSVFGSALNIVLTDGLVSIVSPKVDNGPLNIVLAQLAAPRLESLGLKTGDDVIVQEGVIKIGDLVNVDFDDANVISARLRCRKPILSKSEIQANVELVRDKAVLTGSMLGIGHLLEIQRDRGQSLETGPNLFTRSIKPRLASFLMALRVGEEKDLKTVIENLVGLGPGLTPSSDDMLAGILSIIRLHDSKSGSKRRIDALSKAVISIPSGRTTLVSEELLKQAALGNVNESISGLCSAILTEDQRTVEIETKRVLSIGGSSGMDTIVGIVIGAGLCLDDDFNGFLE